MSEASKTGEVTKVSKMDSAIPTGLWTMYYHNDSAGWTLDSFTKVGSMTTWSEFWTIIEMIKEETLANGSFYFMKNNIPPLWENSANIRGGKYSFPVDKSTASTTFLQYLIAVMLGEATVSKSNEINAITIASKKTHNIVYIWNKDYKKFGNGSDLQIINNTVNLDNNSLIFFSSLYIGIIISTLRVFIYLYRSISKIFLSKTGSTTFSEKFSSVYCLIFVFVEFQVFADFFFLSSRRLVRYVAGLSSLTTNCI